MEFEGGSKKKPPSKKKGDDMKVNTVKSQSDNKDILTPVSPAITSNNVEFANLKNLDDIIKKLTNRLCKPEDLLISRGAESDSIYFISKGIIEIYIDDPRQGKVEDEYFELDQG